ncbi:MAG: polysaccharide biosynthesis protein [Candidatus Krumholzibacteriota bacterium]|nr:polysaccharide biosynthesis protein [Candidatus Krumholzibacteriota bacterium]
MSVLRRVASQASFYLVAETLAQVSGLISFPIFTRIFTQAQYGIMGLVNSTLQLAGTVSGMGLRPAVVRLWGEFKAGQRAGGVQALASTMLSASFLIGVVVWVLLLGVWFLPDHLLPRLARELIVMAAALVLFRNITRMVESIMQSQEKAFLRSLIIVGERYLTLGFALLFVVGFGWGLRGLFGGMLVAEGLLFLFTLGYAARRLRWKPRWLDRRVVRESMLYGLPLLGTNVAGFITDLGDNYLLEYFRGSAELGLYRAGYQLGTYATMFFVAAVNSALIPVTMNLWSEKGPEETRRGLQDFLRWYLLIALPVLFGVWALGGNLIGLMAGEEWLPAAAVLPWVLAAKVIYGAYYPAMAGLYLSKKTGLIALFLGGAALLNVLLNLVFIPGATIIPGRLAIPALGMTGAAITTLIAYAFYVLGGGLLSRRHLRLDFPWRSFAAYLAAAAVMFLVLRLIPSPASNALALLAKVPAGVVIYMALASALDARARDTLSRLGRRLARRGGRS